MFAQQNVGLEQYRPRKTRADAPDFDAPGRLRDRVVRSATLPTHHGTVHCPRMSRLRPTLPTIARVVQHPVRGVFGYARFRFVLIPAQAANRDYTSDRLLAGPEAGIRYSLQDRLLIEVGLSQFRPVKHQPGPPQHIIPVSGLLSSPPETIGQQFLDTLCANPACASQYRHPAPCRQPRAGATPCP